VYQHAEFSPRLNCDKRCELICRSLSSSAYYQNISKAMDTQQLSVGVIIILRKHIVWQPFMKVKARVVHEHPATNPTPFGCLLSLLIIQVNSLCNIFHKSNRMVCRVSEILDTSARRRYMRGTQQWNDVHKFHNPFTTCRPIRLSSNFTDNIGK
jgi:hypothetical protein